MIIDVREPYEFTTRHIVGALNMPLSQILDGTANFDSLSKDTEVVLYCNSGNRSGVAARAFQQAGFNNVKNGINQATVESTYG